MMKVGLQEELIQGHIAKLEVTCAHQILTQNHI